MIGFDHATHAATTRFKNCVGLAGQLAKRRLAAPAEFRRHRPQPRRAGSTQPDRTPSCPWLNFKSVSSASSSSPSPMAAAPGLAEPENWSTFIDLYTNLAAAACRLIGMMPQAKAITVVLNEIVQGLGAVR